MLTFRLVLFGAGSMSIASLLLYFFGVASFSRLSLTLSGIELSLLVALTWWACTRRHEEAKRLLTFALWAGCLATLAYDLVRVPIVHAGIPVFKAISYFGTVLLGRDRPTGLSDLVGWTYHLANGISFALMYAAMAVRPGPVTAILWGLCLEGAMLLTPYAEVFGYQRDLRFMSITVGSHAIYGLVLWLTLRRLPASRVNLSRTHVAAGVSALALGIVVMAADFNRLYAHKLPQSPPPVLGPHLYTAWNVPEPDRVTAIWVMKRYVDHDATFHFIEPFEHVRVGIPFDMPEAQVRRSATRSATQNLVAGHELNERKLNVLAGITALTEISPWRLSADGDALKFAEQLRHVSQSACGGRLSTRCLPDLLRYLDEWYAAEDR